MKKRIYTIIAFTLVILLNISVFSPVVTAQQLSEIIEDELQVLEPVLVQGSEKAENPDEQEPEPILLMETGEPAPTFQFITGVKITDKDGNNLGTDITKNSEIQIYFDFALPNNHSVKAGDSYSVKMPKEIKIEGEIVFHLNDEDSVKVADVKVNESGEVVITFTDYPESHSNVTGFFYINASFNENEIGNKTPVVISFLVEGRADPYEVEVNFEQANPSIKKSGEYNKAENTITWTVTVNPDQMTVNNGVLTDDILAGMKFIENTFAITPAVSGTFNYAPAQADDSLKTGTITYTFPTEIEDTYTITYVTEVNAPLGTKLDNKAVLSYGIDSSTDATASVTPTVTFIRKSGNVQGKGTEQEIKWTITINPESVSMTNATIVDIIPAGLELKAGSVMKDGIQVEDYTFEGGKLTYTFNDTINEPHTLTFITIINNLDNLLSENGKIPFENSATITATNPTIPESEKTAGSGPVNITSSVIEKRGMGYNRSTQEITWQITVNANKIDIQGAVVTDIIPDGQEYVEGSASINKEDRGSFTSIPNESANKLEYTFDSNGENKGIYVITFKTKVMDKELTSSNSSKDYNNTAMIIVKGKESESTGTQRVISKVLEKKGIDYDHQTKQITWQVTVNQNNMNLTNVVLRDVIGEEQAFVKDSVFIGGVKANLAPNAQDKPQDRYYYDETNKTIFFYFGDISEQKYITFKTKVTDDSVFCKNGNAVIKNTAYLKHDYITNEISSEGSRSIQNTLISKEAATKNASIFIDWKVTLNTNRIKLIKSQLKDTLQEGLELDTSSVKLYELVLGKDGSLTQGSQISYSTSSVKYNKETREAIFTLPNGTDKAMMLTFRTNIVDRTKTPFSNSISFEGDSLSESSTSGSVRAIAQGGGGGAEGEGGSITLIKVDEYNQSRVLSGGEFELLDKDKNPLDFGVTGDDGKIIFNKLKFDEDYYIREVTAPKGYKLSGELYKFQVTNSADNKNITYQFKNSKIPTGGGGGGWNPPPKEDPEVKNPDTGRGNMVSGLVGYAVLIGLSAIAIKNRE